MVRNHRVVAIVQGRLGSVRFPRKVLQSLDGRPAIQLLLERAASAETIDEVVLAVPSGLKDDPLEVLAQQIGFRCIRGHLTDVLDRYLKAAKAARATTVVRLTGDCPLVDPEVIDSVVGQVLGGQVDWASTGRTFPDGLDVAAATIEALELAASSAVDPYDREHVFTWIQRSDALRGETLEHFRDLSSVRITLDEPSDLVVLREVIRVADGLPINVKMIGDLWDSNPDVFLPNRHLVRNEGADMATGQKLWRHALNRIPGGSMLLSKRAEMTLPGLWPAYFDRASGCEVWDLDGNHYFDVGLMGVGTNILGYAHPKVNEAVRNVVEKGALSTLNAPEEVALADRLCELHPWADMVRLTRSGGEAGAVAVRIARAASGKDAVAFCGYHGWHDWYLAANIADDSALDGHLLRGLEPAGVPRALRGSAKAFNYNDVESLRRLLEEGDIGTIITEVERSIPPAPGFLQGLRTLADEFGAVLIFDECSSGFRQVLGGHHLVHGVDPDIAIFGKTLGNGFAINAVIGRGSVMEAANRTFISSTFWTERVGPAAALAALQTMEDEDAPARIHDIGRRVADRWRAAAAACGLKIDVVGLPALSNFSVQGRNPGTVKAYLAQSLLARGYLGANAIYSSIAHEDAVLDAYFEVFGEILIEVAERSDEELGEVLPHGPSWTGFGRLT